MPALSACKAGFVYNREFFICVRRKDRVGYMQDTIAALATAPVKGAIGVLRISGENAAEIAGKVFCGKRRLEDNPRQMLYGDFLSGDGVVIDRGLAVFFAAPGSYTGENVAEFYCHGSVTVLGEILNALYRAGARPAKPGEYTRRAFLNGKMDLTQAEAVIDLIDSETVQAAKNAAAQLDGVMAQNISAAREPLVDIASEFYAYVDYPDDEIEQDEIERATHTLREVKEKLLKLAASFEKGRLLRDGVSCAIIGQPNVGKSSVLNAMLGYERSIVTDIAGTTRDTVEEIFNLGGIRLRLIDTAGIHLTDDAVERQGVERARKAAENAELILAVFDGGKELDAEDREILNMLSEKKAVGIINKSDLKVVTCERDISEYFSGRCCTVSAKESVGFDLLQKIIAEIFAVESIPCAGETVTNPRHAAALRSAAEYVGCAEQALCSGITPDVAVGDIEQALNALEELTGRRASEQVLERIFERFCVGK